MRAVTARACAERERSALHPQADGCESSRRELGRVSLRPWAGAFFWGEKDFRDACAEKYADELGERAERLVRETGRPIVHIANELGIHREALRQWVRQGRGRQGD